MNNDFLKMWEKTIVILSSSLMHIISTDNSYSSHTFDLICNNYVNGISDEICPFIAYSPDGIEEFNICNISCGFGDWLVLNDRGGICLYIEDIGKFIYKGVEYVNNRSSY
ncbi:hypothetical protein HI145_RS02455 [Escherichia coli]|nr:hypothetical protein [Escherichia coli]